MNDILTKFDDLDSTADFPCEAPKPPDADGVASEGKLADVGMPELFAHLFYGAKTGVLEVTSRGGLQQIYFENGRVVGLADDRPTETLAKYLVQEGAIEHDDAFLSLGTL